MPDAKGKPALARQVAVRARSAAQVDAALAPIRAKVYPRAVTGLYARWRVVLVIATQLLYYGLPWLQWNGRQAVLFDLGARKFYLFGMVLWPQDVIYLAVLLVLSAFALFLFTAVAGRLFCGYACPQTVYTEIFLWVERKIEGDRLARIRLDSAPWNGRKLRLKAAKHCIWLLIAGWTGFTFIGYFAPIRALGADLLQWQLGIWQWFWMGFYAFATWGNAGFLRESVCKYMCPYARFQSVMVDQDTLVVSYDPVRGEPRGGRSRRIDHKAAGLGDCVDCSLCVQVCPTNIDIRAGLQYMCIGCGACIDACNQVMEKMQYPQGLIGYTSERAINERLTPVQARRRVFRPRILAYASLLCLIAVALFTAMATRSPLRMDVIRDRGVLGREVPGGWVENVYRLQLMNATEAAMTLQLHAAGLPDLTVAQAQGGQSTVHLDAAAHRLVPVVVRLPAGTQPGLHAISLSVRTPQGDVLAMEKTRFYIPD